MCNELSSYKPWEEYPEIWKTEGAFWSWLRGGLRRGIWEKSQIKLDFKNNNCKPPPPDYTGRAKSGEYCALSGKWVNKSKLEVDHTTGHVSLTSWEDLLPFIMHLIPKKGTLQLVDKEAHKIKSYAERMGISYEEAVVKKTAIQFFKDNKGAAKQIALLVKMGIDDSLLNTAKSRREALENHLFEESKHD